VNALLWSAAMLSAFSTARVSSSLEAQSLVSISPSIRATFPPSLRIHRQHVDDVGPVVAVSVAITEQLRGDRVAVGLIVDQNAAEVVSRFRVERFEQSSEVVVVVVHPPDDA
jgi:hypothetical protein